MDRTCNACGDRITVYERLAPGGIPVLLRYRCTCGATFDLLTQPGTTVMAFLACVMLGAATFEVTRPGYVKDRWGIAAVLAAVGIWLGALVARSRARAKANPDYTHKRPVE